MDLDATEDLCAALEARGVKFDRVVMNPPFGAKWVHDERTYRRRGPPIPLGHSETDRYEDTTRTFVFDTTRQDYRIVTESLALLDSGGRAVMIVGSASSPRNVQNLERDRGRTTRSPATRTSTPGCAATST